MPTRHNGNSGMARRARGDVRWTSFHPVGPVVVRSACIAFHPKSTFRCTYYHNTLELLSAGASG
jgi:hypothetical protein